MALKNIIKIAAGDPGKQRDSFGFVAIEVIPQDNEIHIKFAKRWLRQDYLDVEEEIAKYHKKINFNNIYIERNNTGEHVVEVLKRKYHLPVNAVTTSAKITDPKKLHGIKSMGKNEMVGWFLKAKQKHIIKFPQDTQNIDIRELERQISIFAEHKTDAGNVSYYAPGDEHDDLVMALLIACFAARKYIRFGTTGLRMVSSVQMYDNSDDLGTGLTGSQLPTGKSTQWKRPPSPTRRFRIT